MQPSDLAALILLSVGFACGFMAGNMWGYSRARDRHWKWLSKFQKDMKKLTDPEGGNNG